MPGKIIHIYRRAYDSYFPPKDSEYYYLAGWSSLLSRKTLRYTDRYRIENWRPEREVNEPVVKEIQGITCRLFPVRYIKHFGDWSPSMIRAIRKEVDTKEILIHNNAIHDNLLYIIPYLFRNVPVVAHHHGEYHPLHNYARTKSIGSLMRYFVEKSSLRRVDQFFVSVRAEEEYLSSILNNGSISFGPVVGIDFDVIKPYDRALARERLGLRQDKKILLYVGRCYALKGVDILLKSFNELKRRYNLELLIVGSLPEDQFYKEASSSGAIIHSYVPHKEMPLYYSAADLFVSLPFYELGAGFIGTGIASLEALACGIPVVSTGLIHFPSEEWRLIGKIPKNPDDVSDCISEVLEAPRFFKRCREMVVKYYNWENIISRIVETYDLLFKKYYHRN